MKPEPKMEDIRNGRRYVEIDLVMADVNQPRKNFSEASLKELADSIRENGIIQDLLVEPLNIPKGKFLLLDGERRWRAAKLAGLQVVPIAERQISEKQRAAVQIVANQQRENLTALEEAAAYQREIEQGRHTAESLHKSLGISRAKLYQRLALNRLSMPVRDALVAGKVSVTVAGLITLIPGEKAQLEALKDCMPNKEEWREEPLSFREAQELIEEEYCKPLKGAPFDMERIYEGQFKDESSDGQLSPVTFKSRGGCKACPFRSENLEGVEVTNPNLCTRPRCYGAKAAAHAADLVMKAEEAGKTVLPKSESKKIFTTYNPTSPGGGYMDLGSTCYQDAKRRTYREILGKDAPEGVMAFNGNNKLQQVWDSKKVAAALKEKGVKVQTQSTMDSSYAQEEAKRKAEQKFLNAAATKALPVMREKLAKLPTAEAWRVVASYLCQNWQFMQSRGIRRRDELDRKVKGMKEDEMRSMVLECALHLHEPVESYSAAFDDEFEKGAELCGVDLKALVAKEKAAPEPKGVTTKNAKSAKKGKAKK